MDRGDELTGMDLRELIRSTAALAAMGTLVGRIAVAAEGEPLPGTADQQTTVLITGANRGIGLEFARRYAGRDWRVIATCRNPDKAEALQALKAQHGNLSIFCSTMPASAVVWKTSCSAG